MRATMTATLAAAFLCLTIPAARPVAVGQEKPAESNALDPRLKPFIGTWEGRVELRSSREEQGRTLVIQEKAGQLEGRYGISGKGLERVALSVEPGASRPRIQFTTGSGNTVSLELAREDWLSGKMTLTGGGRGGGSSERPMEMQRKK